MTDASLTKMQAAIAPKPTATFEPEVLGTKANDVFGVRFIRQLLHGAGQAQLTFQSDGTYAIQGISGAPRGVPLDSGKYWFNGARLKPQSVYACVTAQGKIASCLPVYQVYIAKQEARRSELYLSLWMIKALTESAPSATNRCPWFISRPQMSKPFRS